MPGLLCMLVFNSQIWDWECLNRKILSLTIQQI